MKKLHVIGNVVVVHEESNVYTNKRANCKLSKELKIYIYVYIQGWQLGTVQAMQ